MKAPSITSLVLSAALFAPATQIVHSAMPSVRLDLGFDAQVEGSVAAIIAGSDGSVTLGGEFDTVNGAHRAGLAKLESDGSLAPQFDPRADGPVSALALLPDGSIAVGGRFTRIDGSLAPNFAVLSPAGELASGWPAVHGGVACIAAHSSAGLVLGGSIQSVFGQDRLYLARLESAGALDAAFVPALQRSWAIESGVSAVAALPDGKSLVGGVFETAAGPESLVRLEANGALDESFAGDCGPILYVGAILPLADGRLYVAGQDPDGKGFVRRLNADRSLDGTFDAPEFDGKVNALALDSRGRVLAGGAFQSPARAVVRLKQDGSIDPYWDAQLEGVARAIAIDSQSRILVGGLLRSGPNLNGVVRLVDASSVTAFSTNAGVFRARLRVEAGRTYAVEASTDLHNWTEVSTEVATQHELEVREENTSSRRHRFFRARLIQ